MHRCLYVSDILILVFECFQVDPYDDCFRSYLDYDEEAPVNPKTLASLARTCRLFSSPALDILWKCLWCFDPLFDLFCQMASPAADDQWSTFCGYAERVKIVDVEIISHQDRDRVEEFISALQYCPKAYLPLLPNVTHLMYRGNSLPPVDSCLRKVKYLVGPAVTTISLRFRQGMSSADWIVLAELPRFCPNVTALAIIADCVWSDKASQEMGRMVAQWPALRSMETSTLSKPVIDRLLTQESLETLSIHHTYYSPTFSGKIPNSIREMSLWAENLSYCRRFFENVYASPTKLSLGISLDSREVAYIEDTFRMLPRCIDTSRLHSLTIVAGEVIGHTLNLLISPLIQFSALHELDLDSICTACMSDADYVSLAEPLIHLRSLKVGTAQCCVEVWPVASVGALITVLSCCKHLETLHIVFNGSISPDSTSQGNDKEGLTEEQAYWGWGVSNRRITKLRVGHSPIKEAAVRVMASCFQSILPCLVKIEGEGKEWKAVQDLL